MRHKQKGFTLIELLVVIAIIGILAAIVIVALNSARQSARDSRRAGDLEAVQKADELYYDENGQRYALNIQALVDAGYLQGMPTDPSSGAEYTYGVPLGRQAYIVMATLERGGSDLLANDIDGIVYGVNCDDPNYCVGIAP